MGNFVLPGLGTALFAGQSRTGWWKPALLSVVGMGVSLGGAVLVISLTGPVPTEERLEVVFVEQPINLIWLAVGALLVLGGGVFVLAGYLWSVGTTIKRWNQEGL